MTSDHSRTRGVRPVALALALWAATAHAEPVPIAIAPFTGRCFHAAALAERVRAHVDSTVTVGAPPRGSRQEVRVVERPGEIEVQVTACDGSVVVGSAQGLSKNARQPSSQATVAPKKGRPIYDCSTLLQRTIPDDDCATALEVAALIVARAALPLNVAQPRGAGAQARAHRNHPAGAAGRRASTAAAAAAGQTAGDRDRETRGATGGRAGADSRRHAAAATARPRAPLGRRAAALPSTAPSPSTATAPTSRPASWRSASVAAASASACAATSKATSPSLRRPRRSGSTFAAPSWRSRPTPTCRCASEPCASCLARPCRCGACARAAISHPLTHVIVSAGLERPLALPARPRAPLFDRRGSASTPPCGASSWP